MTTDKDTLNFLMRGGWFALEQAGRLVNDARRLFESGSYGTAAGLALLSREELAKSRELFSLWIKAIRGATITRTQAIAQVEGMSHTAKQRRGGGSFSIPVDETALRVLLAGRDAAPDKYDDIVRRQWLMFERMMKRAPSDRTEQRERAFYVDSSADRSRWLRPAEMTRGDAEQILEEARLDYWQQHRVPGIPGLDRDLQRLRTALERWNDKPELPPADWRV